MQGQWYSDGCVVGPKTTYAKTFCYCNHLTTFGSGFAVQPNTIDFAFVFSHASFTQNPTLYVMEMVIAVIYIAGFIWARRQDKKDLQKFGITPLPDNDPCDKYLYEITVSTGLRKNAGTDSKVHFILSGDENETDARTFADEQRKIFRRGATDSFLLAVPRPLGTLHYLKIWHDNSGTGGAASWYLNYINVRDVQTREKYQFIANQWFAVEEGDGQISRCISVSSEDQMVGTEHLFSSKGRRGLSDDHIWFSVFARPARSRFTRLQRLSCCLCLLFTAMLANAMFYGIATSSSSGVTIGPFSLSGEQVYVGIISNLVTFPINFLIAFLFKRSRPRRKHASRVQEALKTMKECRSASSTMPHYESMVPPGYDCHHSENASPTPVSNPNHSDPFDPEQYPELWDNGQIRDLELQEPKKKRFSLPWWCVIVGWILLWITVGLCVAFVTFYGIMFQDDKCKKWITSMFISFFTSVLLTQPIKVLLFALFFALIFKKPFDDEDVDEMEDEEDPNLGPDEMYLHRAAITGGSARAQTIAYKPPDPMALQRARIQRMKELQMFDVIREVGIYAFYVWIIVVISYEFHDPNSFRFKENMRVAFVSGGSFSAVPNQNLVSMQTMDDFWVWLNETVAPSLRADNWYNGKRPLGLRGFLGDYVSRIMGFATLRQLRVKRGACSIAPQMQKMIHICRAGYSFENEETDSYDVGWTELGDNGSEIEPPYEYIYRHSSEIDSQPYLGALTMYGGGGYVAQLRGSRSAIFSKIAELKSGGWIDEYTRAVFLEFAVYNPNANLFGAATLIAELMESGGFTYYYQFVPMNLLGSQSSIAVFYLALKVIYLLFVIFFIVRELRAIYKQRRAYFTQFWNWVEIVVIGLSIGASIIFAYRYIMTLKLLDIFRRSGGNAYMKFQTVAYWHECLQCALALIVFWSTIKFIKLLRFNKTMSLLGSTLKYASTPLFWFSIMFLLLFFAFLQFFYLTYNAQFFTFSTIVQTTEECMQMLVGKFDFNELLAGGNLGTIMFFVYMTVCFFILLTMFVTIINEAFAAVQNDLSKQSNEHELVDFIVDRFVKWSGLTKVAKKLSEIGNKKRPESVKEQDFHSIELLESFNQRIERFVECVNEIIVSTDEDNGGTEPGAAGKRQWPQKKSCSWMEP
jgi:polycystin 1L2